MDKFTSVVCACHQCLNMCKQRPCWGTPAEIEAIKAAGYGNRLMRDWWEDDGKFPFTMMEQPALKGHEGRNAPVWPMGECTFLTADGKCELHDKGLKPLEGRVMRHDSPGQLSDAVRHEIVKSWQGVEVVDND